RKIMAENKITSLSELVDRMQRNSQPGLREAVIDAMTTNETLWFRDVHPFRILEEKLIPELAGPQQNQPIRIWSAACSTGQEPYSIAMVVEEYRKKKHGLFRAPVSIIATDISSRVLASAKEGEYELLAIGRGLSAERKRNFFTRTPIGRASCRERFGSGVAGAAGAEKTM